MPRQNPFPTLLILAVAGATVAAPWARGAESAGLRQQPLTPIATPAGRSPTGTPGITGSLGTGRSDSSRQDPGADDTLPGLRRPQPDTSSQIGASLTYRGTQYVITEGQWYERRGRDLVAVTPPSGVLVRELPKGYAMRWIGGVPYFYADGLYYVWREGSRRYEILQSPPSDEAPPASSGGEETRRSAPSP